MVWKLTLYLLVVHSVNCSNPHKCFSIKGPFGPPLAWSKTMFWTKIAKFDEFGPSIYKNCDFKNAKFWRFNTEAKPSFFENGGFNVCASQFFHLLNYYTELKYLLIDQKPRSRYISKKKKKTLSFSPLLFLLYCAAHCWSQEFQPSFFFCTSASKISGIQKKLFIN